MGLDVRAQGLDLRVDHPTSQKLPSVFTEVPGLSPYSQYLKVGVCAAATGPAGPHHTQDGAAIGILDGELGEEGVPGL